MAYRGIAPAGEQSRRVRNGFKSFGTPINFQLPERGNSMNNIVYIVGLIVIVIAILSFFGLR
jgi:hypothetical protein